MSNAGTRVVAAAIVVGLAAARGATLSAAPVLRAASPAPAALRTANPAASSVVHAGGAARFALTQPDLPPAGREATAPAGAPADRRVPASLIERVAIPSPAARVGALGAYVYLPPGYADAVNASVRYPVLYLIHGFPGWPSDWFLPAQTGLAMDALLAAGRARPMILVAPTANSSHLVDSECLNAVGGPQLETYLTRDVVAFIDAHYRTIARRAGRGIGGISAGGYCALNLGLRHAGAYSVILAEMPYGDPGSPADITGRLLGGSSALYRENSPRLYLPAYRFRRPVDFFFDVGAADREIIAQTKALAALVRAHHQRVDLQVVPGESHSWRLGRLEVPDSLVYASTHFDRTLPPVDALSVALR